MTRRKSIRLGLAALNQIPLDWRGNLQRIREVWERARALDVRILCLPELAITGYGCEDRFLHPDTGRRALRLANELAAECGDDVLLVGLPVWVDNMLFNGMAVLHQGAIAGITLKNHLARDGIHYEPRWFRPWPLGKTDHLPFDDHSIPIGNLVYRADDFPFAIEICEDAWVANSERPCSRYGAADWIFNASASHFSLGKADIRERIVCQSSADFDTTYSYTNLVGCESGRAIYDGEILIADKGQIIARSERLYLHETLLLTHDHLYTPKTQSNMIHLPLGEVPIPEPLPPLDIRERCYPGPEREFVQAATLALFDYMRKSRSRGFTLSLSGGVDSSAVAVLVFLTAVRILTELSPRERQHALGYLGDDWQAANHPHELVGLLLTTVYQATENSGSVTREAAAELAAAIGARHLEFDVAKLVTSYVDMVGQAIERPLSWERDDIALQNIQARVRGPGVWMLANLSGSLLLTTSNRSEVAVGYATMDGDTCGGLAPIAGVEKTFLRHWLIQLELGKVPGIPAIPVLALVNQQRPTAELRPAEQTQTDEEDLMPYEVLDALEEALIANRGTPAEAFAEVYSQFRETFSLDQIYQWTRKFCRLFAVTQWKRERYAPSFHLDDRNLDPRTWARYPILSGAFEVELTELDQSFHWLQEEVGQAR